MQVTKMLDSSPLVVFFSFFPTYQSYLSCFFLLFLFPLNISLFLHISIIFSLFVLYSFLCLCVLMKMLLLHKGLPYRGKNALVPCKSRVRHQNKITHQQWCCDLEIWAGTSWNINQNGQTALTFTVSTRCSTMEVKQSCSIRVFWIVILTLVRKIVIETDGRMQFWVFRSCRFHEYALGPTQGRKYLLALVSPSTWSSYWGRWLMDLNAFCLHRPYDRYHLNRGTDSGHLKLDFGLWYQRRPSRRMLSRRNTEVIKIC